MAPSPLVSRVYQELSNGLIAYNMATKMKEVPVPFAYVQFNALLLQLFSVITPIAVACFTRNIVVSVLIAVTVVGGFGAMWLVANELEDPFGADDNDLPLVEYHEHFVKSVYAVIYAPWMPADQWTVSSGKWCDPRLQDAFESVIKFPKMGKWSALAADTSSDSPPPPSLDETSNGKQERVGSPVDNQSENTTSTELTPTPCRSAGRDVGMSWARSARLENTVMEDVDTHVDLEDR